MTVERVDRLLQDRLVVPQEAAYRGEDQDNGASITSRI
ncbi:hypothetical protein STRAU_5911 [Streptomyces aurantiacus JA 4570]|uniref:Uncharacterized protein n=1 Tax=Streptomyces aurantiacus JA 4570 TaxID=1286094 RepID=S3ZD39_9ACTN|nr:hypothetical protein STRAU_5911 [Streptomyces aurantiacus JA 4570]